MIESGELLPTGGAYDIEGGRPLRGEIRLSGAKNAATKLIVAALLRVLAPPDWVEAAAVVWIVGYGLFVFAFWTVLTRPRVDGKPG